MKLTTWIKYLLATLTVALFIPTAPAQASPVIRTEGANYEFPTESYYQRFMRLGYAAMQREDYMIAAEYFKNAFYERPNDQQAVIAYTNATEYFNSTESKPTITPTASGYAHLIPLSNHSIRQRDYQNGLPHLPKLDEKPSR